MTVIDRVRRENPFKAEENMELHTFEEAVEVGADIQEHFGRQQNEECAKLRDGMIQKDPNSTGRIPLSSIQGKRIESFVFLEPEQYLRDLGVLDESDAQVGPQILIPNYVNSMSNCAEPSPFFSICCLDVCGSVMGKLERAIRKPKASAEEIANALTGVTTVSTEVPRNLAPGSKLREMLESVATKSGRGGAIEIHGFLLAQWLHYAFPHDCPTPAKAGSISPVITSEWQKKDGVETIDFSKVGTQRRETRTAEQK